MKRHPYRFVLGIGIFLLIVAIITSMPVPNSGFSGGVSGDSTDGCLCHGASADPSITTTITGVPPTYTLGQTYALTIDVSGVPGVTQGGFDLTVDKGTFSNPGPNAQLSGDKEVIHSNFDAITWTVDWTAPASNSGTVTFNVAGIMVDGDGTSNGDQWNLATYTSNDPSGAVLEKTILTLDLPREVNVTDNITIIATLLDKDGNPLENLTVDFYRSSTFGMVYIGQNVTDSQGRSIIHHTVSYSPFNGTVQIEAVFNGTSTYESIHLITIIVIDLGELPSEPFDFSFLLMTVIVIVGAVWMVFGYVLLQIYYIWKEGKLK